MALVEGLDDAVDSEMARIRAELKRAIKASPHTMSEIASMAGVDQSSIYRFLSGATSALTDNVVRVGLIAGARLLISAPKRKSGDADVPFRIVPAKGSMTSPSVSTSSTSRAASPTSRSAKRDIVRTTPTSEPKRTGDQRRKRASGGGDNCEYYALVIDLRKHRRVSPEGCLRRSA